MIRPLKHNVVVLEHAAETVSKGGIFLTTTAAERVRTVVKATVMAIPASPEFTEEFGLSVKDVVLIEPGSGIETEQNGEKYRILDVGDVLAVVNEGA